MELAEVGRAQQLRPQACQCKPGLTENARRENDGPSKLQGMKLQDVKMMDQFAGHEIARHEITRQEIAGRENAGHENARHENDGPKMTTGREMAKEKSTSL